jgi:hypothetical protein
VPVCGNATGMAELLLLVELHALEAAYWYEVDHDYGRAAQHLYEPDGTFTIGDTVLRGREAIAGFYRRREERGDRTARHVITNPHLTVVSEDHARFETIMLLYADDGVPVIESKPAVMIADVVTEYVRTGGAWSVRARTLRPVFEGGAGAIKA